VPVTVAVSNPCKTATVSSIVFNPSAIAVNDGSSAEAEFPVPGDTVDTANSLTGLCGTKTYTLTDAADNSSVTSWVSVIDSTTNASTGGKVIKVNTLNYGSEITTGTKVITINVLAKYADSDYSGVSGTTTTIVVTITKATCSCAAMVWTAPTISTGTVAIGSTLDLPTTQVSSNPYFPPPVSSDAAKSTNAAFNQCWADSTPCTTAGTYAANNIVFNTGGGETALAAPLAWDNTNQKLVFTPTLTS
jgi:hypothetical protein